MNIDEDLYPDLLTYYGQQHWWPAKTHFEVIVGAVLTQNTNWNNVETAIRNFNGQLSPLFIREASLDTLKDIIRPSGFFNQKAVYLKAITDWYETYDFNRDAVRQVDLYTLRSQLLSVKGIGRETADSILLYAFELPIFVVDAYTRRLLQRLYGQCPTDYDKIRISFEQAFPCNPEIFNELHALIVIHAKNHCQSKPKCQGCPLLQNCFYDKNSENHADN